MIPPFLRRARRIAAAMPWRIRRAADAWSKGGFAAADLVTLDVFDTALLRSVARPVDAFWLAAWRTNQRLGISLDIETTARARIAAEDKARILARQAGRFEVTFAEIFAELPETVAPREALMAEEIATERDVCFANPDILELFRALQAHGRRVAFISDTYMPRQLVAELLSRAGYGDNLAIFASSEYGRSKADGSLFDIVASSTGTAPRRIWHIGDNPVADVRRARAAGWNALWYNLSRFRNEHAGSQAGGARLVSTSLMAGIASSLQHRSASTDDAAAVVWRRIGIEVAGPIFLGFAQFVAADALSAKTDRVAFCARDGRIIMQVYERLRAAMPALPPSTYLLVSRRALVFPMLTHIGAAEMDFLTAQFAAMRVAEFLTRIGLDPQHYADAIRRFGLTPETIVATQTEMIALRGLLQDLAPDILRQAARERDLLAAYMRQENCLNEGDIALVDVGWQGSLQKAAARLFTHYAPGTRLRGLYFGTNPSVRDIESECGHTAGWFVDAGTPADRYQLTRTQWAVLELLFTAPHGSVLQYRRGPTGVEAMFDESGAGDMAPYEHAADAIQAAALEFVDRYIAAFGAATPVPIAAEDVAPRLKRLVLAPTLSEARCIGDLFHVDGFGATRTGQYIARPPQSGRMRAYRQASWRRGYLVRTFGGPWRAAAAIAAIRLVRPRFKSA